MAKRKKKAKKAKRKAKKSTAKSRRRSKAKKATSKKKKRKTSKKKVKKRTAKKAKKKTVKKKAKKKTTKKKKAAKKVAKTATSKKAKKKASPKSSKEKDTVVVKPSKENSNFDKFMNMGPGFEEKVETYSPQKRSRSRTSHFDDFDTSRKALEDDFYSDDEDMGLESELSFGGYEDEDEEASERLASLRNDPGFGHDE